MGLTWKVYLGVLVTVLVYLAVADAITCYTCDSDELGDCGFTFDEATADTCTGVRCLKTTHGDRVTRECTSLTEGAELKCKKDACFCDKDKCNTSGHVMPTSGFVLLLLAAVTTVIARR